MLWNVTETLTWELRVEGTWWPLRRRWNWDPTRTVIIGSISEGVRNQWRWPVSARVTRYGNRDASSNSGGLSSRWWSWSRGWSRRWWRRDKWKPLSWRWSRGKLLNSKLGNSYCRRLRSPGRLRWWSWSRCRWQRECTRRSSGPTTGRERSRSTAYQSTIRKFLPWLFRQQVLRLSLFFWICVLLLFVFGIIVFQSGNAIQVSHARIIAHGLRGVVLIVVVIIINDDIVFITWLGNRSGCSRLLVIWSSC